MNMTLEQIKEIANEYAAKVGMTLDIPVVINGRLTRTLGCVRSVRNTRTGYVEATQMDISRQMLDTCSEDSIRSVIGHEVAHYVVIQETHASHGHDAVFKAACARLGVENDKPATEVERVVAVHSKYEVWCDTCNENVGNYSRMCKTLQNLAFCTCNKCKTSNLRLVQNW